MSAEAEIKMSGLLCDMDKNHLSNNSHVPPLTLKLSKKDISVQKQQLKQNFNINKT